MDHLLSPLARLFARLLGRAPYCAPDCPNGLGWPEYLLLALLFLGAFMGTRWLARRLRRFGEEHRRP